MHYFNYTTKEVCVGLYQPNLDINGQRKIGVYIYKTFCRSSPLITIVKLGNCKTVANLIQFQQNYLPAVVGLERLFLSPWDEGDMGSCHSVKD